MAVEADQADLLARYLDAFQRYDMDQLVTLLHQDAVMSMPPYSLWLSGAENICRWMVQPAPSLCKDSVLVPAGQVNGVHGVGAVQAGPGRRARALGAAGARGLGRAVQPADVLPGYRADLCRPGLAAAPAVNAA